MKFAQHMQHYMTKAKQELIAEAKMEPEPEEKDNVYLQML